MSVFNFKTAALAIVAGVGLSGCAYGPYGGLGVGASYGNGYGYGNYYDPYYGSGYYGANYNRYGYGYGQPYYGWYDGYYYPGTGYYVYDRNRRAHRWSDTQRRYWEWRQRASRSNPASTGTGRILENWVDFQNGPQIANRTVQRTISSSPTVRSRELTAEQRAAWTQQRAARAERRAERAERRTERAEASSERASTRSTRRGRKID
jgi:hypothetical protein